MSQDDKRLVLLDLCCRLPYGVICKDENTNFTGSLRAIGANYNMVTLHCDVDDEQCYLYNIKPYLFPMSSMTVEQEKEYISYVWFDGIQLSWESFDGVMLSEIDALIDFFHKNHIDYHGLIEKGLALDATGLNIYQS